MNVEENKLVEKDKKDNKIWTLILAIIVVVLIVITIGLPLWRKEAKKNLIQAPIEDESEKLITRKKQLLKEIEKDNQELVKLVKFRKKSLVLSRIALVVLLIFLNLLYHLYFSSSSDNWSGWIDDFRNFTTFLILIYTTLGFIIYGNVKLFSKKIRQRVFRNAFKKEFYLKNSIEQMNSTLIKIDEKINTTYN